MKAILFSITLLISLILISCSEKTTQPFANTIATPVFSLASGIYHPSQTLTINCSSPGATIRYTINGSVPDKQSPLYSAPIIIDSTQTVKAVAFKKGWNQSAVASVNLEMYNSGMTDIVHIMQVTATPDSIYADGGITHSLIRAKVVNSEAFGVQGQLVTFQTTLGIITQEAVTDENGFATSTFSGENLAGSAHITISTRKYHPEHPDFVICADTMYKDVSILQIPLVQQVHAIEFTHSGQLDLDVINTGGVSSAPLEVRLLDEDSNLVTEPQNVWFRIINSSPPAGVNLDNHAMQDSVLAISVNGIAQVTINSGTGSGIVTVRASCTSGGNYLQAIKPDIFIHAATPHNIVVFASGYNTGENMAGGLWRIVVGAVVTDINNNPIGYGTSVWFSLPDNETNCTVQSYSYVGNESIYGDSTAGVAYTTLTYSGVYTFESIKLRASTGGINGIEVIGQDFIVLPLNQPQLEVEIVPGNIVFHGNTNPTPASAVASINVSVFDIQGNAIHNARIILSSTRGVFEYTPGTNIDPLNCNSELTPNIIVTDWYDAHAVEIPGDPTTYTDVPGGQDGLAQGLIRFYAWEIPLGDPMVGNPGVTSVTISGRLLGTNIESSSTTTLIRYPT